jgi:hypothetical protein
MYVLAAIKGTPASRHRVLEDQAKTGQLPATARAARLTYWWLSPTYKESPS